MILIVSRLYMIYSVRNIVYDDVESNLFVCICPSCDVNLV